MVSSAELIQARAYYMSDRAYDHLVLLAKRARYVQFSGDKNIGLSNFINDLASIPLHDTRPDLVKRRHRDEIRLNRAPVWLNVRQRRARLFKLTDDCISRLILVAYEVGIIRQEPWPVGGPDRKTPYPTVAFVLEAIGLGWLTLEEFPVNGKHK